MNKHKLIMWAELSLAVVLLGSVFFKVTSKPPASNTPPDTSSGDSMADHHKPKPSDSSIFSALLDQPAPDFTLSTFDGKNIRLSDLKGKNVLLFFNEGLMCYPACWEQIAAFGQDSEFAGANTQVLSITVDPKSQWERAVSQMPKLASATVLLDTDKTVSNAYGVTTLESSMHRGQFPGHTYILIDKEGIVRFQLDDPAMAIRNKQLLEQVAKL